GSVLLSQHKFCTEAPPGMQLLAVLQYVEIAPLHGPSSSGYIPVVPVDLQMNPCSPAGADPQPGFVQFGQVMCCWGFVVDLSIDTRHECVPWFRISTYASGT